MESAFNAACAPDFAVRQRAPCCRHDRRRESRRITRSGTRPRRRIELLASSCELLVAEERGEVIDAWA